MKTFYISIKIFLSILLLIKSDEDNGDKKSFTIIKSDNDFIKPMI